MVGGILPVEGKGPLPLPQSGGGKGGLRGPLDGIAGAIAVAAQPALPGCGAAGFPRQDDPAAPNPGKAIGFGEGADLDGAAFGAGDGINAAGAAPPRKGRRRRRYPPAAGCRCGWPSSPIPSFPPGKGRRRWDYWGCRGRLSRALRPPPAWGESHFPPGRAAKKTGCPAASAWAR